jgi:hypothetical protein
MKQIEDPLELINKNREKFKEDYKNELHQVYRAAYETFENSKCGKQMQDILRKKLYAPIGPDVDAKYMAGQHDMIRMIFGWIKSYELLAQGIEHG